MGVENFGGDEAARAALKERQTLGKIRSAPKKNWERTWEKLGAHLRKIRSAPRKNWERT